MKKLISILFLVAIGFFAVAQGGTDKLDLENTFIDWTLTDADTVSGTSSATYVLTVNKHQPTTQDVLVVLDSIDVPGVTVQLKGKKFLESSYTNIGSAVEWAGTSADTTIEISNSTANRYRYLGLTVTATTGKAQVTTLKEKVYIE